jgi:hypothetical protein
LLGGFVFAAGAAVVVSGIMVPVKSSCKATFVVHHAKKMQVMPDLPRAGLWPTTLRTMAMDTGCRAQWYPIFTAESCS